MVADLSTSTICGHSFVNVARTDASRKVTIVETQREFGLGDRHAPTMIPLRGAATPLSVYKEIYVHRYTHAVLMYIHLELYRFYLPRPDAEVGTLVEERRKS